MPKKTYRDWFNQYEVCHRNHTNEVIHWICVPIIAVSVLALLWDVPFPQQPLTWMNWSVVAMFVAFIFYVRLSLRLAIGMAVCFLAVASLIAGFQLISDLPIWIPSLILFCAAWVGQFIGHKIEGKKPAFFEDLQFLLIGPLWVLDALYQRLGL